MACESLAVSVTLDMPSQMLKRTCSEGSGGGKEVGMESHSSAQSSLFSAPDEEPHFKKLSPSWTQAGYESP